MGDLQAGGIKLADGKTMQVAAKSYEDESNADRIQELYTRLATEDGDAIRARLAPRGTR